MKRFGFRLLLTEYSPIMNIRACIFDLDGVIVDTARYHFIAWRRMANALGFDFGPERNEELKGVSRKGSMKIILEWGNIQLSDQEKDKWMARKNDWYLEQVHEMDASDLLEGALPFMESVKASGRQVALGSASKNAQTVLQQIGLSDYFAAVVDGTQTTRSKPDPQVFELAAQRMGAIPAQTIVFEDAFKGVEAAKNGGFYAVGIGQPTVLTNADLVLPDFVGTDIEALIANLSAVQS